MEYLVVLVLGIAGYLLLDRLGSKAHAKREARREAAIDAVRTYAHSKGWRIVLGFDDDDTLDWRLSGNTAAGRAFTLERHLHIPPRGEEGFDKVDELRWACPALGQPTDAFLLVQRSVVEQARSQTGDVIVGAAELVAQAVRAGGATADTSQAEDEVDLLRTGTLVRSAALGPRWRLATGNPPLAEQVFDPAMCSLLRNLPRSQQGGADTDSKFEISLGPWGLMVTLGFRTPKPGEKPERRMVDLVTSIAERLEAALPA